MSNGNPGPAIAGSTIKLLGIDEMPSSRIYRLHDYWSSKRHDGRIPQPQDMNPDEIRPLIPYIVFVSIEHEPFRVFYRECGRQIETLDFPLGGKYLEEIPEGMPPWKDEYRIMYQWASDHHRPVLGFHHILAVQFAARADFYLGIWPLSSDGKTVDACIAMEDFV